MAPTMPAVAEVEELLDRLAGEAPVATDAGRIDLIAALERLKSGAAAAQARLAVAFDASQRAEQAAAGVPAGQQGKGIAAQVALARRESPHKGNRLLGLAKALVGEMPHTLHELARGNLNEWRATLLVRETACVSAEHRSLIDTLLADRFAELGDRRIAAEARKLTYRLDPTSVLRRTRGAHRDRRVSVRPAPDTMSYLTGFLPAAQGIACHTALARHADSRRASGDPRSRGQIMADRLVELLTGEAVPDAPPVELQLVMTDRTLLGKDDAPAHLHGYGPIPAWLARDLARGPDPSHTDPDMTRIHDRARVWVRRLFLSPEGALAALDSRRRTFDGLLRRFLVVRDESCRTPWCDAPIRHLDHIGRAADGAPTTAEDGQGLCEACNYTKEAPGWRATPTRAGPRHEVTIRTPTGHTYTSAAPDPPGSGPDGEPRTLTTDSLPLPLGSRTG